MEHDARKRYQIVETVGRGGMGTVFRARDTVTGRDVALKVVHIESASSAERFRREGEITAKLSHPGIVRVHSGGPFGQRQAHLAYELIEGAKTLESEFTTLTRERRCELLVEIGRALGYAHAAGIVHRDVKPANVLLDSQGRARVSDFGVATAQGLQPLTKTGAMIGTPYYMSPEAFSMGKAQVGPAADVWALGVILYEALTGVSPFSGESAWELAAQIAKAAPPPPHSIASDVPASHERVCMKALAGDPAHRYADGNAFADDLVRACEGRSVLAPRFRRSRPKPWIALALIPVAVLIAIVVTYDPGHVVPAPPDTSGTKPIRQRAPTAEAAAAPGWALRSGQTFLCNLGWIDERQYPPPQNGAGGPSNDHRVGFTQFQLDQTVRSASPSTVSLENRIASLRVYGIDQVTLSYDSTQKGLHLIPLAHAVDQTITVHMQAHTGRVKKSIGLTAIKEEALNRTGFAFRQPVQYATLSFDDLGLRRRLEVLWHLLPEHTGELPDSWELERSFWPRRELEIRHTLRFEHADGEVRGTLVRWSVGKADTLATTLSEVSIVCSGRFKDGRLVAASFAFEAHIKSPKEEFDTYQALHYGDEPFPESWEETFAAPRMLPR